MRTILYGILRTLPVLRSVKPRCFLHLAAQGIAICIEEHLPLENRPLCVVAEGRDLTAAVPVAHAQGLHEKEVLKKPGVGRAQACERSAKGPNAEFCHGRTTRACCSAGCCLRGATKFGSEHLLCILLSVGFSIPPRPSLEFPHQSGIWNESMACSLPHPTVVPLLSKHVVKEYVWRHSS